jgi:hypothetical protein
LKKEEEKRNDGMMEKSKSNVSGGYRKRKENGQMTTGLCALQSRIECVNV